MPALSQHGSGGWRWAAEVADTTRERDRQRGQLRRCLQGTVELYTAADGARVYNQGEKRLLVSTLGISMDISISISIDIGISISIDTRMGISIGCSKWSRCTRLSGPTTRWCGGAARYESGRDVSSIVHKASGQHTPLLVDENGVCVLDMLAARHSEGFTGPEQR